jgi:hypothetical protein
MWDAIIVEDEGKFIMNGGVIQGGMNGVVVEESASIDINNATFLNNHVSIQKKWQTDDAVQFDISDSRFAVTDGGLLPPLAGAINAQGIKAFSQNSPSVRLLGNNHFENFLLGVNAQQSNIAIQDGTTFFKDIRAAGVYAGADGKRTFTGEGMRFENVRTAVEVRNMNVVCTGSVMDNVAYGFRLYNGKERDFDITNNTINSRHFGVLMFNWKPGAKKDISNNTINILSGGSGTGVGIRLANMLDNSSFVNVIDNPITCGKGAQGIHLLDANSILMEGNTITRTGSAQVWDGILTDGGSSNMAICNGIGSTNPNGNSNAVLVDMSSSFTASCNSFNNTDTGLRFIGVNSPSIVEGNNFHALDIGVQVGEPLFSTNGFIGEQPHAGNQWPGQIGSDGLVYIGDIDEAQWSKFIINNGLMGTQFDPSADPPQFKDYDPNGSTFACSSCTPPPPVDGYFIQDHECDIANGSVVSAIFPAAQLWTAQRHLYRRLLKHQNLISNNDCTDAFFTNKTPTTIGKFEKIRKDINGLFELDNGDVQAMDGHRQSQNNLYDQLLMTYDQLTTASSADSILLANQKDNLLASLDSVATAIDVIDQAHQATWKANAQSIILDNAAIITSQVWEQNQQAYNQVWLEMTVNNQAFPDSVQLATLMGIANQCPYAGGEAVYQSRGLLSEDLVFDDVSLCNTGAQGYQKEDIQTALEFNVYPNPGKDHIVIELKDAANWGGNVTLTDMLGRFVRSQVIADGDQQAFLMLDAVPAGVYNLKVEVHGLTNVVKISVVK